MAAKKSKQAPLAETVYEKLRALYKIQCIDNEINKIETLRGELPLEVQDLEDEIAGLETRLSKIKNEIKEAENEVSNKKNEIVNAQTLIKKYEEQQMNVRNNREFESIAKEIRYQNYEIEHREKDIRELAGKIKQNQEVYEKTEVIHNEKKVDLEHKRPELDSIIAETKVEEERLLASKENVKKLIDERLYNAYTRIKNNAKNRLAVVTFDRESCGGCFNAIPPQRMVDIRNYKKIIDCEYCGRILIDPETAKEVANETKK
ncbi:MAG TPA: C4-type zinc ribbon domain-containing protein [Salinivirgaceae bacterium]|nr:C4-type zinc ribbon domain-containing protein [Salinivirgaceae bacterium]